MSGTHLLHFSGRLGLHEASYRVFVWKGQYGWVTADIMIRRPFPFVGTAGLSHAYGLAFFMFYQFSVLSHGIWPSLIGALSSFVLRCAFHS